MLFFSLALLTKYNAILLGIGCFGLYFYIIKKQIEGPSYGHIIAATIIIALIQMPVLFWNLSNDFASFSFHMVERLDQEKDFLSVF